MNTIKTERAMMERDFPKPPDQKWFDDYKMPLSWKLVSGRLKGKYVLDIGCAAGWVGYHAQKEGAIVVCTDIFGTYVHPDMDFIIADKEDLPFKAHLFDFVLTSNVLHHGDLNKTCTEAYRVLKTQGEFISLIEPCIGNQVNEQAYLKEKCSKEIDLGIDEHRPSMEKYRAALFPFSLVEIRRVDMVEAPDDYSGEINIRAVKL